MADLTYHRNLAEMVEKRVQSIMDAMATGNCTFEHYKHQCGVVAGLKEALGYSEEIKRKILGETR